jgi:hypothetical protein
MIHLVINTYPETKPERKIELDRCLAGNRALGFVNIIEHYSVARSVFADLFNIGCVRASKDDIIIVANVDVLFDDTLRMVEGIPDNEAWVLSRWVPDNKGNLIAPAPRYQCCQDSFMVRMPMRKVQLNFPIGHPGSDNRICAEFKNVGYKVRNPSLTIRSIHHHCDTGRTYPYRISTPYLFVEPEKL